MMIHSPYGITVEKVDGLRLSNEERGDNTTLTWSMLGTTTGAALFVHAILFCGSPTVSPCAATTLSLW